MIQAPIDLWALLALLVLILIVAAVALFAGWTMGRQSLLPVQPVAAKRSRKAEDKGNAPRVHSDPWDAAQARGEPVDPDQREETL